MSKFLVRVELHGAKHGDEAYRFLNSEMSDAGFEYTVLLGEEEMQLPPGEFSAEGDLEMADVFDIAAEAADATMKKYKIEAEPGIVVAKLAGEFYVGGLKPVEQT